MTQTDSQQSPYAGKGKAFFDRADQVAGTGNWDFAIELYLEGIQREPDALDRGHKKLREVSMQRKAQGGKGPGMMETIKRRTGKDPVQNLVNSEFLLAKEPGSVNYMVQFHAATRALGLADVMHWICETLMEAMRQAAKPDKRILILLMDSFTELEEYAKAIQACEMARKVAPDDEELLERSKDLAAKNIIKKGGYGEQGKDFTKSVKDIDKQKELLERDSMVQSKSYLEQMADRAREEYLGSPTVPGKINAFIDALLKLEKEEFENEAVDVLRKAEKDTGAYQFKMRIGDIRIRQLSRIVHKFKMAGDNEAVASAAKELAEFELKEFTERASNYPTDLAIKFELGRRQLRAGQLDDAIANLQQAKRDPRRQVQAIAMLGQAFARKGWTREASETFESALNLELTEDQTKELRYLLGVVYQQMKELGKAQDQFSRVAQLDYNFRDVRTRLEDIRKQLGDGSGQA